MAMGFQESNRPTFQSGRRRDRTGLTRRADVNLAKTSRSVMSQQPTSSSQNMGPLHPPAARTEGGKALTGLGLLRYTRLLLVRVSVDMHTRVWMRLVVRQP